MNENGYKKLRERDRKKQVILLEYLGEFHNIETTKQKQ